MVLQPTFNQFILHNQQPGCWTFSDAMNRDVISHRQHRLQSKPLVSDPGMHHGTCVTHMPWFMSGLLICGSGENVPGIPGVCATRSFTYLVRGPWCQSISACTFRPRLSNKRVALIINETTCPTNLLKDCFVAHLLRLYKSRYTAWCC